MDKNTIYQKLELLGNSFQEILNKSNPNTVTSLVSQGKTPDEIKRIQYFDWFQGVGLYGFYKLYEITNNEKYINIIKKYFMERINDGLPPKNVNSMAPMLTLIHLYEITNDSLYKNYCLEWADWLYTSMPRTKEGGFQHITLDSDNDGELWDDTLFMSVLFLAKAGLVFNRDEWVKESINQFFIHEKYLKDKYTGLWYHGWTFNGNHNFVNALWARGNSWITIFIPEFIELLEGYDDDFLSIQQTLNEQVKALIKYQTNDGMWHTLIDDNTSYKEASGTAGFAYGILKAQSLEIIDDSYEEYGLKSISKLIDLVDNNGILQQVSGGTAMGKESLDFYKRIPIEPKPYGQAMAMLALIETLNHIE